MMELEAVRGLDRELAHSLFELEYKAWVASYVRQGKKPPLLLARQWPRTDAERARVELLDSFGLDYHAVGAACEVAKILSRGGEIREDLDEISLERCREPLRLPSDVDLDSLVSIVRALGVMIPLPAAITVAFEKEEAATRAEAHHEAAELRPLSAQVGFDSGDLDDDQD